MSRIVLACGVLSLAFHSGAYAGVCDHRPSQYIGGKAAAAVGAGSAGMAAAGVGMKVMGFYTLTNATTGATMLASTAAGASAAGTTGIIAGTSGAVGAASATVMAPVAVGAAVVVAVSLASLEGICFFKDERITDYDEIDAMMKNLGQNADHSYFSYYPGSGKGKASIGIKIDGDWERYEIKDLYIVNGTLKASDWGLNTVIGNVGFIQQ